MPEAAWARATVATVALATLLAGCAPPQGKSGGQVAVLSYDILAEHPFAPEAFTQGLEVTADGDLLVSTGLNGQSRIYRARIDDATSPIVSEDLDERYFGEGATVHDDTVWQLTWKSGVAFARDAETLQVTDEVSYDGEGWGLCSDDERLVMSDGSAELTFRDPETFAATGRVQVTLDGEPVDLLNELECTGSGDELTVWANVWHTDRVLRIDPDSGEVTGVVELDLPAGERDGADVLNGIAAVADEQDAGAGDGDRFLVTGKLWDTLYEVRFSQM